MKEIEIIEGKSVQVFDKDRIKCLQAAQLLGYTRQHISQQMNVFEKTGGLRGLKCYRDNGDLVTSESALREYYEEVIKKKIDKDKRYGSKKATKKRKRK